MTDSFSIGRALYGVVARHLPLPDSLLFQIRLGVMMSEEFGLSLGGPWQAPFKSLGNLAMVLLAPAPQQRLIGGVLDQRVPETVIRLGRDALHEQHLRVGQLAQRRFELFIFCRGHRA